MAKSVLLIAGETSGEEHALSFIPTLLKSDPEIQLFGVGGEKLAALGMELFYHLKDFSSMGFSEVIGKIPFYLAAAKKIEQEVIKRNCEYAILIDFQDFNLRLAKRLAKRGVKVFYYVAPQAWAWREGRASVIGKTVHTLFCILPFEKKWFMDRGVKNLFCIPHPLLYHFGDEIKHLQRKKWSARLGETPEILLLPGSRPFEVRHLLPAFLETIRRLKVFYPKLKLSLVKVPHIDPKLYAYVEDYDITFYESHELPMALKKADLALAASGTVTLTCGLFGVPTIVAYESSLLNAFIFYNLVRYKGFASLTNIILGDEYYPEFLQSRVIPALMVPKIKSWLSDEQCYNDLTEKLSTVPELMSGDHLDVGEYIARTMKSL